MLNQFKDILKLQLKKRPCKFFGLGLPRSTLAKLEGLHISDYRFSGLNFTTIFVLWLYQLIFTLVGVGEMVAGGSGVATVDENEEDEEEGGGGREEAELTFHGKWGEILKENSVTFPILWNSFSCFWGES